MGGRRSWCGISIQNRYQVEEGIFSVVVTNQAEDKACVRNGSEALMAR